MPADGTAKILGTSVKKQITSPVPTRGTMRHLSAPPLRCGGSALSGDRGGSSCIMMSAQPAMAFISQCTLRMCMASTLTLILTLAPQAEAPSGEDTQ